MELKEIAIAAGMYRPARKLYRALNRRQHRTFVDGCAFYSSLLPKGALCFDVGANKGEVSEMLLEAGARVVAFEPQADCMRELHARCDYAKDRLTTRQVVLGVSEGETVLYIRPWRGASSLHKNWSGPVESEVKVAMTTLDRAIAEFGRPQYLKMDVEGWELEVLRGLTQSIPLVSFEAHQNERDLEKTLGCLDYLARFGPLEINMTSSESFSLAFDAWLPAAEFLRRYPREFEGRVEYEYGDVYVRVAN